MAENPNSRLEAFSDGVFAIALTLLIIDIKIPSTESIHTNGDLWHAIKHITPSIFAFLLSFIVILITWVNHHNFFKLVNKSSPHFIYANGFLLLVVVFIPFPTALLGDNLLTDHAAPAVVLYNSVFAIQAIAWNLLSRSGLQSKLLTKNEQSAIAMRSTLKQSYPAFILYSVLAILGSWFPLSVSIVSGATWIFWLIYGINIEGEEAP